MTRVGVWYDFRNPARWRLPWQQLYRETLDQAVYAEELGFDSIWLSEHHFTGEGYLPCLPAVLGTLAARTARVRLGTAVLLAPLHHPLRLAEDLAVIDQLCSGRLDVGLAPGYKPGEFATLGVPKGERGAEPTRRSSCSGSPGAVSPFPHACLHFRFDDAAVLPPPVQRPGRPPSSPAAASPRRAGPPGTAPASCPTRCSGPGTYDAYRRGLPGRLGASQGGHQPRSVRRREPGAGLGTARRAPLYQFNMYRRWFS